MANMQLTAGAIRELCGDLADWKIAAIIATGASLEDLEEALAWSAGDDETTPHRHLRPQAAASQVCDILSTGEAEEDGR